MSVQVNIYLAFICFALTFHSWSFAALQSTPIQNLSTFSFALIDHLGFEPYHDKNLQNDVHPSTESSKFTLFGGKPRWEPRTLSFCMLTTKTDQTAHMHSGQSTLGGNVILKACLCPGSKFNL